MVTPIPLRLDVITRHIGSKLALSCAALTVGLATPVHAQNAAIAVRSAAPAGEADIVMQGSNNSLLYYHATPGSAWSRDMIGAKGTTFSPAAITVAPAGGEADVVAQGPNNSLLYYHATPGSAWAVDTIGASGTTFSAPSIAVRTTAPAGGEVDVVAQGPNNSLLYYHATPGSAWIVDTIGASGTTFSQPAVAVRSAAPAGEADVTAVGPNNSLLYYHATPGAAWAVDTIGKNFTAFTAPAIAVRSTGEADVVVEGNNNGLETLVYYHATPGSAWAVDAIPGGGGAPQSSPAIAVRATGEADVVAALGSGSPGNYNLLYFWATPGSPWSASNLGSL